MNGGINGQTDNLTGPLTLCNQEKQRDGRRGGRKGRMLGRAARQTDKRVRARYFEVHRKLNQGTNKTSILPNSQPLRASQATPRVRMQTNQSLVHAVSVPTLASLCLLTERPGRRKMKITNTTVADKRQVINYTKATQSISIRP